MGGKRGRFQVGESPVKMPPNSKGTWRASQKKRVEKGKRKALFGTLKILRRAGFVVPLRPQPWSHGQITHRGSTTGLK